jgi:predicted MFS family arabinose efflux permease
MGFYVVGGLSSNLLLNLAGPLLVEPLGWRAIFVVFGLLGAVALAVLIKVVPPPAAVRADPPSLREAGRLIRHRVMWLLGGMQYVRLALVFGLATWLPTFVVEEKGHPLATAGLVVAVCAAVTAPANFLGGYLSDRLGRPLLLIAAAMVTAAASLVLLVAVDGVPGLVAASAAAAASAQLCFGPMFSVPIDIFGARTAGVASGIGNCFANLGALTFITLLGALKDATGSFAAGLYALAGAAVAGLGCTLLVARLHPGGPRRELTA